MTDLEYDLDQHLWLVRKFTCGKDQNGDIENAVFTVVREFRYDSDRGRYLTRARSTDPTKFFKPIGDRWTEYLGDEPYRDFEVDLAGPPGNQTATAVPVRRYIRGYGLIATEDENGGMQFIHGDLLGSTRLMTEGSDAQSLGEPTARGEYLAFGQVVDLSAVVASGIAPTPGIRYGWCGSWGYENDALADLAGGAFGGGVPSDGVPTGGTATLADDELEFGLLHIGARYYSPDVGRFVQRDPIGVGGGPGVYLYVNNSPLAVGDPSGMTSLLETLETELLGLLRGAMPGIRLGAHAVKQMVTRGITTGDIANALLNAQRVVWDPVNGVMSFLLNVTGEGGYLVSVNPASGVVTTVIFKSILKGRLECVPLTLLGGM